MTDIQEETASTDATIADATDEQAAEAVETVETTTDEVAPEKGQADETVETDGKAEEKPEDKEPTDDELAKAERLALEDYKRLRARETQKFQALAEEKKAFEAEKKAFEGAKAESAKPEPERTFKPIEKVDLSVYDPEEDKDAIAFYEKENGKIDTINQFADFAESALPLFQHLYADVAEMAFEKELDRTQRAMDEKYKGYSVDPTKMKEALSEKFDFQKNPFAYRDFNKITNDERRAMMETKDAPELIKRLTDKGVQDKQKAPAKPPATVDAASVSAAAPEEKFDMGSDEGLRKYLLSRGVPENQLSPA